MKLKCSFYKLEKCREGILLANIELKIIHWNAKTAQSKELSTNPKRREMIQLLKMLAKLWSVSNSGIHLKKGLGSSRETKYSKRMLEVWVSGCQ